MAYGFNNDKSKVEIYSKTEVDNEIDNVNDRIDNIITSPAPTEQEIIDARLGADGVNYPSLGDAIRDQVSDLKSDINHIDTALELPLDKTFSGTAGAVWGVITLGTLTLKKEVESHFEFSIAEAKEYAVYVYLKNLDGTNISSGVITVGQTSHQIDYTSTEDNKQVKLAFTVGVATATIVSVHATADGTNKIDQIESDLLSANTSISDVNERQKINSDRVDTLTGNVELYPNCFEIGNIAISNSGWNYNSSDWTEMDKKSRVRTKEGITFSLKAGDIISLSDYTDAKFYIGWQLPDSTYGYAGWETSDYTVTVDAEYVILLAPITPAIQSDIYGLLELLTITRNSIIESMMINNNLIRCINHRGFNSLAPENTLPAFKLSKKYGFEYVETDVAFTSDDVPVLMHDDTVDRTTDGTGNIWDLTYAQVEALDAGSWFSSEYDGTKVPTLEEFMVLCKKLGLKPYLELKATHAPTDAQLDVIAEIVKKTGMVDATTFICVNINPLVGILALLPKCRGGIVSGSSSIDSNIEYIRTHDTYDLFIDTNTITSAQVETCASNGIEVEYWLGSDSDQNWSNIPAYVTGLTSNVRKLSEYWYATIMD